jgi:nucleotide-binding universal stress UspA family protein
MYKRILAAVDGSARSERILESVEYLARVTGASVDVLHAEESEVVYDTEVELEDERDARAVVDRAVTRLEEAGVRVRGEMVRALRGDLPDVLLNRVLELGNDLIVLGPRHHSRLGALLGASVSEEIALHAPTSVLLVI